MKKSKICFQRGAALSNLVAFCAPKKGSMLMKKLALTFLAASAVTLGVALQAGAATTGEFLGTFGGNDPFPDAIFPGTINESIALYKCDEAVGGSCTDENADDDADYSDNFTINFTAFKEGEAIGGTWSFVTDAMTPLLPKYIALKAGSNYSVWDIGGLSTGDWSTVDTLESKGISHISFYDSYAAPVPLPAAGLMLIAGLGGLAMLRRRPSNA